MAEAPTQSTNPDPKTSDPSDPAGGNPKTVTNDPPAASTTGEAIDFSKLTADQLAKALENPELFKVPRIAELLEAQKSLKKLESDKAKADEESLKEQKKFEELATQKSTEVETLTGQLQTERINNALVIALSKDGVIDVDAAVKLVDRGKISVDENGQVQGIGEAVDALKADKAYLFGTGSTKPASVGAPSNQGGTQTPPAGVAKFKRSQLQGPEGQQFYRDNKADIDAAYMRGEIEDDVTPAKV